MKEINKIQLVFPPSTVSGVGFEGCFVPNGLLILANYLKQTHPEIEVEVIDGTVTSLDEIKSRIDSDLFCISALTGNYAPGKEILEIAEKKGIPTVIGNHHATYLYNQKRTGLKVDHVDYIIPNQRGEYAFENLVSALNGENYTKQGKIPRLKDLTRPDLSFIKDFTPYFEKYEEIFGNWHEDEVKSININNIIGCYQGIKAPCLYCCLKDFKMDMLSPNNYWEKVSEKFDEGFNYIFETANSLSSLKYFGNRSKEGDFLTRLASAFPNDLKNKVQMQVYGTAPEIDYEVVYNFKEMNVHRTIFGFDARDSKKIGKFGGEKGQNLKVAKMLDEAGIQIFGCYVPGYANQTLYDLEKTNEEIMQIMELPNTSVIEYTSLAPMPGSRAFEIVRKDYEKEFGKKDVFNIVDLAKTWVKTQVPDLSWDIIEKHKDNLKTEAEKRGIVFGGYY